MNGLMGLAAKRPDVAPLSANYYAEICDIDFFSAPRYRLRLDGVAIDIAEPGLPIWSTFSERGKPSPANRDRIKREYLRLLDAETAQESVSCHEFSMLLALETAYREGRDLLTRQLIRGLATTSARDRGVRIGRALDARRLLSHFVSATAQGSLPTPTLRFRSQPVEYLAEKLPSSLHRSGWSIADVAVEAPVYRDFVARGVSITTPREVLAFYRDTLSYIFELTAANHQVETLSNYMRALAALRSAGVETVLDYGAGIGTFTLLCAERGLKPTYADLASETFNYAAWRFSQRQSAGADIRMAAIEEDGEVPEGEWDAVICTEVLEHVFEPEELIGKLLSKIRPGGLLVVSESYDYVEEFCTHLPIHQGKGGQSFIEHMLERRLGPVLVTNDCHVQVWKKPL